MKEKFKKIRTAGTVRIKLKGTNQVWEAPKANIMSAIVNIAESYQKQGYQLTLRQLYYQLVARDIIPNHDTVYKKISALKDDCVYGGYVDWEIFEDRGRVPKIAYFEDDVHGALKRTKSSYALDRQLNQDNHIEVWTEKDAISDILKRVTHPLTIRLVVNKGYSSSTAMYGAYKRFIKAIADGKKVKILYFGDHDPSGLDMVRDISERIIFFMKEGYRKAKTRKIIEPWIESDQCQDFVDAHYSDDEWWSDDEEPRFDVWRAFFETHFEIKHIGLTMNQIEAYNPPHNPAKITDPRADAYIQKFGQKSWEVDALEPSVMTQIVRDAIWEEMDLTKYEEVLAAEEADIEKLGELIDQISEDDDTSKN